MSGMSAIVLWAALLGSGQAASAPDLRGGWALETYLLKDGSRQTLAGRIVFTDREWLVLYFITGEQGPQQGSGEGGTYTLNGDKLVFTHHYNLSGSRKPEGSKPPLTMELHDPARAPTEPCVVKLEGDRLVINFIPSGNSIVFRRTSRF